MYPMTQTYHQSNCQRTSTCKAQDSGGTLILIAGKQHMPAEYLNTPLKDLIAVRLPESVEPDPAAGLP